MIRTRQEIVDYCGDLARETQIDTLIAHFVNVTLGEINDPAWALGGYNHNWTFLRRTNSITTVDSTETYVLPRDLDKISLVRQTTTPQKLLYVPDEVFYSYLPYPTTTGNPLYYRLWEEEGFSTVLSTADTIDVVSSSTSDTTQTVTVKGYDANGILQTESYSLNGTTSQSGSTTFAANRPIIVSKSADTVGDVTLTENSGSTTLVVIGKDERSPRFKKIGLYPIPSSAISIYLEYFTRIPILENATDTPILDEKWTWVICQGVLAKIYQYQNKEGLANAAVGLYTQGVGSMAKADMLTPDYIPMLKRTSLYKPGVRQLADDSYSLTY